MSRDQYDRGNRGRRDEEQGPERWWFAYSIKEYIDSDNKRQSRWTRIGRVFKNRDGSMNVEFDALPVGDRMQIRQETHEEAADRERRREERREDRRRRR